MQKIAMILLLTFSFSHAFAKKYDKNVKECLEYWGKTPFNKDKLDYTIHAAAVNVLGAGKDIVDDKKTDKPSLVFIKPSVNVLGKTTIKLLNPNGWYCLKSNTNVLGKAVIELHCKAKMAISNTGATVLGSDESDQGTTVLGKTKIKRIGCN